LPELPSNGRFLPGDHEEEEEEEDEPGVSEEGPGLKEHRLSSENEQNPEIHRVSHVAVEAAYDEAPRRIDRSGRPAPRCCEVPDAPEIDGGSGGQQSGAHVTQRTDRQSVLPGRREENAPRHIDRNGARDQDRKEESLRERTGAVAEAHGPATDEDISDSI
jgi:hypothetical protein